ncbi:MAG: hypothetical protein HYT76_02375 [Deltaproteobacteria bacterium]|nr:hypothetical protein [Deltaproteobacteria bacterium]
MSMSRATLVRNFLTLVGAGIAIACAGRSSDSSPSDGGADAIGGDGGDSGTTPPVVTTATPDMGPANVAPDPDAGAPSAAVPDEVFYVLRGTTPRDGASARRFLLGDSSPSLFGSGFRYNSVFKAHGPSATSDGRVCELSSSGGADVAYNAYVRCFEKNADGEYVASWENRGDADPSDGLAPESIVEGRLVLGESVIGDAAMEMFTDGVWAYFTRYRLGQVVAVNLADGMVSAYLPVNNRGCMGPTAIVEGGGLIYTFAEAADGTGRACVINPSLDEKVAPELGEELALTGNHPKMAVDVGDNRMLIVASGPLNDLTAPVVRGVEKFNYEETDETPASEGILWDGVALCSGVEEGLEGCTSAIPLHISYSQALGMGAVTFMYPGAGLGDMEYRVRLFTSEGEGGTRMFALGAVVFSQSRIQSTEPTSPGGIEGTAFMDGTHIFITHRRGAHTYNIETGELTEVAGIGADGFSPNGAPAVLPGGDEESL